MYLFKLSNDTFPESLAEFSREAQIIRQKEHTEITFPWATGLAAIEGPATAEFENCHTRVWECLVWPDEKTRQGVSPERPVLATGIRLPGSATKVEITLDAEVFAMKAFADQWQLDVAMLVAGGRTFKRFQGYRIVNPTGELTALAISRPNGRFGNNFNQLLNAIQLCKHFQVSRLYVPKLSQFAVPRSRARIGGIEFVSYKDRREIKDSALLGTFFYKNSFGTMLKHGATHQQKLVNEYVRRLFAPAHDLSLSPPHHIAVHIRSSDLFDRPNPHAGYPQPPLAYYKQVLAHFREKYPQPHVALVYQDRANPVIGALESYLQSEGLPFTTHSSTLDHDLKVLMSHETMVFGRGTFGKAVVSLAPHVRCVYFPWTDADFRFVIRAREAEGYVVSEIEPRYIKVGEWANTEQQRRQMLEYPDHNLTLARYQP